MHDRLSMHQARSLDPREALLAFLSLFFHAAGFAALLAGLWLILSPIQLPRLRPYLMAPVIFTAAGSPAPRLGGGVNSPPAPAIQPVDEQTAEPLHAQLSQLEAVSIPVADEPGFSDAGSVVVLRESPPRVGFRESAQDAVSRRHSNPGTLHGRPVAVQRTTTVAFPLSH